MERGREEVGRHWEKVRGQSLEKARGERRTTGIRGYWRRGRAEGHSVYFGKI